MALPGRLRLPAVVVRVAKDEVARLGGTPFPLAVAPARAADAEAGLVAVARAEACLGAAEPTRRLETAVRAVETVVRDDKDEADVPDEVEDTLPA